MEINIWAVLAAAASSFLLGGLWYSPLHHTGQFLLFGLAVGALH